MTPHEITILLLGATVGSILTTWFNLVGEMLADARARLRAARATVAQTDTVPVRLDKTDRGGAA